jgi:integrase
MQLAKSKTPEGKRPVPVPKALMEKLLLFRDSSSDLVFPSQRGKPIDQSVMNKAWKKALEAAGHPYTNPYQMRKMFGTMHARKSTESVLQRLMRHRDVRTTKQFYVRVSDGDLRDAVD